MCTIRYAQEADVQKIAALAIQVWLSTYAVEGIRQSLADYVLRDLTPDQFAARLADPQRMILLLERKQHLIGFCEILRGAAHPATSSQTEIETLYLQEPFCGKGLGTWFFRKIVAELRQHQIASCWLSVWHYNQRAIRFYSRLGFTRVGTTWFQLEDESHENDILEYQIHL